MKALLCAVLVAAPLSGALAEQLPAIDTLTPSSSFAAFVRPDVPVDIHRQAMRRLWALNPALSGPDLMDMDAPQTGMMTAAVPAAAASVPMAATPSALPPVDTLSRQSDYAAYLAKDVPLATHQAAMRRLWAMHPELAVYSADDVHSVGAYADIVDTKPQTSAALAVPTRTAID